MAVYRKGVLIPDAPKSPHHELHLDRPHDHNTQFNLLKTAARPLHLFVVDVAAFRFGLSNTKRQRVFTGHYNECALWLSRESRVPHDKF